MTLYRLLLLAVALFARVAAGGEPAEFASIPYREVCPPASAQTDCSSPAYSVRSSLPGVTSQDIKFKLTAGTTVRDVSVGENGELTLAYDQALWDADAVLVSNQPKGSLKLIIRVSFPLRLGDVEVDLDELLSDGRISYAKMHRAASMKKEAAQRTARPSLAQAPASAAHRSASESNLATESGELRADLPTQSGYTLLFLWPSTGRAFAGAHLEKSHSTIYSQILSATYPDDFTSVSGEPLLTRDKSGIYYLMCSPELLLRNPDVVLSAEHKWKCALFDSADVLAHFPFLTAALQRSADRAEQASGANIPAAPAR